jgi:4-hydroxybenzoate polyprenyltransferase
MNILSLDVVAGAVAGALFFGKILQVQISFPVLIALALTVWIIYTLDHLRDAKQISNVASTDRHRFHQENFRAVLSAMMIVFLVDLVLIWYIPREVLIAGIILASTVLCYLIFQRYLKFLKEFFVACLYTAGILLPSLAFSETHLLPVHHLIIVKYLITALMNLLLFSLVDYNQDRDHKQHSFVTWFGPTSTSYGIVLLGLVNIFSGFFLWRYDPRVALIFICMNLLLLAVLFFREKLVVNNYYRILGDAVFLIPLLYLL